MIHPCNIIPYCFVFFLVFARGQNSVAKGINIYVLPRLCSDTSDSDLFTWACGLDLGASQGIETNEFSSTV